MGLTAAKIASAGGMSVNTSILRDLDADTSNTGVLELLREEFGKMMDDGLFFITSFQEGKGYKSHALLDGKVGFLQYECADALMNLDRSGGVLRTRPQS